MSDLRRPFSIILLALLYPLASVATLGLFVKEWIGGDFPDLLGPFPTTWSLAVVLWMLATGHGVFWRHGWGRLMAVLLHVVTPIAVVVLVWMDKDGVRPLGAPYELWHMGLAVVIHLVLANFYLRSQTARRWFRGQD